MLASTASALRYRSLQDALKEQGLWPLLLRLREIVPDISRQYTTHEIDPRHELKTRGQHAFQMQLFQRAVELVGPCSSLTVVDIGDSAGTHLRYAKALASSKIRTLSVNLDPVAVEKVRSHGMEALCARAEQISKHGITAEIFLCLETLEHLRDPISFLRDLAVSAKESVLVLTVPYQKRSRVGLEFIRNERSDSVCAEDTHVFELSPDDWKLAFRYAGWKVQYEQIYYQYPRRGLLRPMQIDWRRADFEGFFGVVMTPDFTWADRYTSW